MAFPTTASTATPTSDLFYGPSTTSSSNGGGGGGGGNNSPWAGQGPGTTAYFQTVIISLVALAVLLVISVLFLYYRRRRLRVYAAQDWPFDRNLVAMLHGAGGHGGGGAGANGREKKEIGEKPDMWEVGLEIGEDEKEGLMRGEREMGMGMGGGEGRGLGEVNAGGFESWQPLTIASPTTTPIKKSSSSSSSDPNSSSTAQSSSAPSIAHHHRGNFIARTFNTHNRPSPLAAESRSVSPGPEGGEGSGAASASRERERERERPNVGGFTTLHRLKQGGENRPQPNSMEFATSSSATTYPPTANGTTTSTPALPLHLTYIIAMPQNPALASSAREARARSSFDLYDDDAEDIPDVELGTTIIGMDVDDLPSRRNLSAGVPSHALAGLGGNGVGELVVPEMKSEELRGALGLPVKRPKGRRQGSSRRL